MIVTKAPMRITLAGGGTDVASRYHDGFEGATLSVAIDLPVWATVCRRFDSMVVASYASVERVPDARSLKNELVRCLLMETGFLTSIEVHSISQLSLAACGLGGSSSFAVALALALLRLRAVEGKPIRYDSYNAGGAKALAEYVEMVLLNKHIGGQDHAIANAGGIWRFSYQKGYATSGHALGFLAFATLRDRMVLVPCASRAHDASEILKRQFKDLRIAEKMVSLVTPCAEALNRGEIGLVIEFLNQTWDLKAQLDGVPCASADAIVRLVRERGGGAKLCGAGGGGCVLCLMRNTEDVSKLTKEFEGAIAINPSFRGLEQVV